MDGASGIAGLPEGLYRTRKREVIRAALAWGRVLIHRIPDHARRSTWATRANI